MSYKNLKSYQQTEIIYDFTVDFCKKYIYFSSRTIDQMTQAARSGKQNIVEATSNPTSEKSELKLLGVARASLEELLEDYKDFLRQHDLLIWEKDHNLAHEVRQLAYKTYTSHMSYRSYIDNAETAANAMICLINQTNYLLDRQIKSVEENFIKKGGYSENLHKQREQERKRKGTWLR